MRHLQLLVRTQPRIAIGGALHELILATEQMLDLTQQRRERTVLRIDAGGGSFNNINWILKRGYQLHCKDFSPRRAANLAKYVREWHSDPRHPDRQLGWMVAGSAGYVREVRRLIIRWRKRNGQIAYFTLLSTLEPKDVMSLLGQPVELTQDPLAVVVAYAHLYDLRGGAVEIEFKSDKQGIGLTKRNKKRYAAQQMVMLLGSLAHNVVMWAKRWLVAEAPKLKKYGVHRIIRDVLQVSGFLDLGSADEIKRIVLNCTSSLARHCVKSWRVLLKREHVAVILGES